MSLADQLRGPASVQVSVQQARGLRIKGKAGTNDAYAVMQVGKEKFQTSVAEKSVAPVWGEEAAFDLPPGGGGGKEERSTLHVHVLHRALVGPDKLLGQAVVDLPHLSEDKSRSKTEWFKLLDKSGKADKDRGEVLLDIHFMRNNMTSSMFDLSAGTKSRSRLGKFKDKVRGKKRDSDTVSNMPSFNQVLTESDEEEGGGEVTAGNGEKKKLKTKSLFSSKSNLQRNLSQSMTVLTAKALTPSGSQSSVPNVDSSEGKKKFKFPIHKRSNSSDGKDASSGHQKPGATEQSNVCINGSHVYRDEPPARASRSGSSFSLTSSGHGSMEDVPESFPQSIDSLRAMRECSPWMEEEEEQQEEEKLENKKDNVGQIRSEAEEKNRMEEMKREEVERVGRKELERLADEKTRREEDEKRTGKVRDEEEKIRWEEKEMMRQEEEERHKREQEECERLDEQKRCIEEERVLKEKMAEEEMLRRQEERRLAEQESRRKEEEERFRMEEERVQKEMMRRQEEEERLRRQKEEKERVKRQKEEEEERVKRQKEEEERVKRQKEEEERVKRQKEEEEERVKRQKEEEERVKRQKEEEERVKRQKEEEERVKGQKEEEERVKGQKEEEERVKGQKEEEEQVGKLKEKECKLIEEKRMMEERITKVVKMAEEERIRRDKEIEEGKHKEKELEERMEKARREKEEHGRLVEEKRRLEEEERRRLEAEEKVRHEEEERIREEERKVEKEKKLAEEKRILEEQEKRIQSERKQREEEEMIAQEASARKEKEEHERLVAQKMRREQERRKIEEEKIKEEERIRREMKEMSVREAQKKNTKTKAAQKKPTAAHEPLEVSSNNPFDDNFSNNPFEELPDSPAGPDGRAAKVSTVQQRLQFTASSVGSEPVSSDDKDPINTQRERRAAPQPPGRNQAERLSRWESAESEEMNKKSKDLRTVSVLPQRSLQTAAPRSKSHAEKKEKSPQGRAAKETSDAAKPNKRAAPPIPRPAAGEAPSEQKTHAAVSGLNPFEEDEDDAPDDSTPRGDAGSVGWPPVTLLAADSDQTKVKSSKARAPPLPATSSAPIGPDAGGGRAAGVTGGAVGPAPGAGSTVRAEEAPLQEDAGGTKAVAPVASRRLQPVKPLNPLEQQSASVVQGVNGAGVKGPYSQLTRGELVSLVLKQEKQLSERDKTISDLEQYIDNLLVRVIEEKPSILLSLNSLKRAT
ncbi:rab11fip1 [Pungitius sinensis]